MQWYFHALRNYATFRGRARRAEFWMFALVSWLIAIPLAIIGAVLFGGSGAENGALALVDLYSLAVFLPSLALTVRRLHDVGRSGWWLFIALVPFIGAIVLLVFYCTDSQPGPNQYGPNPKDANAATATSFA
jgi:uncharacterized membrane protein YhaH (DUF805 family)